jgi:hypothetical protein
VTVLGALCHRQEPPLAETGRKEPFRAPERPQPSAQIRPVWGASHSVPGVTDSGKGAPLTDSNAGNRVFDGRYRFSRYFSPKQHNRPTSLEALFILNDVELFDVESDPLGQRNLAVDPGRHRDLLEAMNAKLNALIDQEVGEDVGQMLPGGVSGGWVTTDAVYDV